MTVAHKSRIWFDNNEAEQLKIEAYPGGEVRVGRFAGAVRTVHAQISCPAGIQALFQVADIIRRRQVAQYGGYDGQELPSPGLLQAALPTLELRYMPYARQDRTDLLKEFNQAHALGIFARQLNSMGWGKVVLWDPHSDVTPALVNNAVVVPRVDLVRTTIDHLRIRHGEDLALVVPDQGAFKATMAIADEYGVETVCVGEKLRDMKTGEITGTFVHNVQHLKGKVVLIADDICDGGRTFTALAEFITGKVSVKSLALYVTHGIFSKGIADLMTMDRFNLVACPNVFNSSNSGAGVLSCRVAGVEVNRKANTTFFTF